MAEKLEIYLVKFDSVKRKIASQGECYHLKIAIFVHVWRSISVERYILGKKPEAQTENIANILFAGALGDNAHPFVIGVVGLPREL